MTCGVSCGQPDRHTLKLIGTKAFQTRMYSSKMRTTHLESYVLQFQWPLPEIIDLASPEGVPQCL